MVTRIQSISLLSYDFLMPTSRDMSSLTSMREFLKKATLFLIKVALEIEFSRVLFWMRVFWREEIMKSSSRREFDLEVTV